MALSARRARRPLDIWPGFVDALASLLLVIIFVLLVFALAQFFLGATLSDRDASLRSLHGDYPAWLPRRCRRRSDSERTRRAANDAR